MEKAGRKCVDSGGSKRRKRRKSRVKFGIDRDQENSEIKEYLRTHDERIFEKVYKRRIPTIDHLAKKYTWLSEDAASEICVVFVRTVNQYGRNGRTTDFNTFFFSSVKNHFANAAKKKYRKKRTTFDGSDPALKTIPLDSCIDSESGSLLFHELIAFDNHGLLNEAKLEDYLQDICGKNAFACDILRDFSHFTRRQIVRRQYVISFCFPIITGDIAADVYDGSGLPGDSFDIIEARVDSGNIRGEIELDVRKFLSFVAEMIYEKGVILQPVRG